MYADIVFPEHNEKKFVIIAEQLGFKALIFAYSKSPPDLSTIKTKLKLFTALIHKKKRYKESFSTFFVARGKEHARLLIEKSPVDVIFDIEMGDQNDFMHHRASGLNQVLCKLASMKGKIIGFSVSSLLQAKKTKRSVIMGRMMQNIVLCRKYKTKMAIASFARDPQSMRSVHDLIALGIVLGIPPAEAKQAMKIAGTTCKEKTKKKGHLGEGLELLDN